MISMGPSVKFLAPIFAGTSYACYPISTLPEHLHSTFPSYAKLPENTLTEKKNIPFPSLTLITCLTGPPVTPPPLHWETQPHPLIHNHSVLSAQGERSFS